MKIAINKLEEMKQYYDGAINTYFNIKCNSIKGRRKNAKHFVLDGKIEVLE